MEPKPWKQEAKWEPKPKARQRAELEPQPKPEPKISFMVGYWLLLFAIVADLINWIPGINLLVAWTILPLFSLYYFMNGLRGTAHFATQIVQYIVETVPALSILPATSIGVLIIIILDRLEATKLGSEAIGKAKETIPATK